MTTSIFDNTYESDVPLAGTAGAPIPPTDVLSITDNLTTHIDQQIYHFWVNNSSCLEASISHFQNSGFSDCHFTRFSSCEGWERSYHNAVLLKDTLLTIGAQPTTIVAPPLISSPPSNPFALINRPTTLVILLYYQICFIDQILPIF